MKRATPKSGPKTRRSVVRDGPNGRPEHTGMNTEGAMAPSSAESVGDAAALLQRLSELRERCGQSTAQVPETPTPTAATAPSPQRRQQLSLNVNSETGALTQVQQGKAMTGKAVDVLHRTTLDAVTYAGLANGCDEVLLESSVQYLYEYLAQMSPRSPVERMLAVQMLWQHARLAELIRKASAIADPHRRRAVDAAIDSGLNVARRQAMAWAQLRSPRTVQYFGGNQVNVADQQVVANGFTGLEAGGGSANAANEQGCRDRTGRDDGRGRAVLPPGQAVQALVGGAGIPSILGHGEPALDHVHRPADPRGEGPGVEERPEARPSSGGRPGLAAHDP
jgi:hypothetical protein